MQKRTVQWFGLFALPSSGLGALVADLVFHCAERAAIERVYHDHRLGEKPSFEQMLPNRFCELLKL